MENTTGNNNEQVKQNWMAKTYQFHRYELNLKQHGFNDERHTTAVDADGGVTALAFKQGDVAVVNSNDGTVKQRIEADQPQGMCINDLRVLARGQKIATGGGSKNVNVWDVETGQLEAGLEGHSGEVSVVRGNARALISASSTDDCINIWDLRKKVSTKTLYPSGSVVAMEYFQTPAFTLITGLAHSVRVWDLRKTGEVLKEFSVGGCLRCMAINPSHDRVVIGSSDKNGNGIITVASTSTWDVVHAVREFGPRNLKFKAVFNLHVDEYKIVAGTQNANEGAAAGNIHIFNSAGDISESPTHARTLTELHGGYQNSVCVKGANMWGLGDSNSYEPATSQLLKWDFS